MYPYKDSIRTGMAARDMMAVVTIQRIILMAPHLAARRPPLPMLWAYRDISCIGNGCVYKSGTGNPADNAQVYGDDTGIQKDAFFYLQ